MSHVWFTGSYDSWQEARALTSGYDDPGILAKVVAATRAVRAGHAAFERDGVTFPAPHYARTLLACLLYVAARSDKTLRLMDVGGSLGSTYWQHRGALRHLNEIRWSIVERSPLVRAGQREITDGVLRFYDSLEDCVRSERPCAALLSSVLPYVERPYQLLEALMGHRVRFIIVERTPFLPAAAADRLTIQHVPPEIYDATYPAWFLSLPLFRAFIERSAYRIVRDLPSWERWTLDGHEPVTSRCLLLECRTAGRRVDRIGAETR